LSALSFYSHNQSDVLEEQDPKKQEKRQKGSADASGEGLEGHKGLGARAKG
jgi:hypothetical protein